MSVQQKNWTDLPDDIKRTIFDFNRKDASIKKQQNKNRYEMVVGDIKIQWEHSQDGVHWIDHDEYGRQIDDIIPPPFAYLSGFICTYLPPNALIKALPIDS